MIDTSSQTSLGKKNLEFSIFGLNHPPNLVITENLKKIHAFDFISHSEL